MIISKTPYRISFFGGGTDYPEWHLKNEGKVISTTINKYLYISCRFLPNFFNHKYRIVWSKVENVKKIDQIEHKAIREILNYLKIKQGLEIHYDGDLPSRSGMGSSSSFVVGLLKVLYRIKNYNLTNPELAKKSIFIEQKILKETVGSQDQVAVSYGGFNKIIFKNNLIKVNPIGNKKKLETLNDNLVLIFTGLQRTAYKIADKYVNTLNTTKKATMNKILQQATEAEKILKYGEIDDFGRLLHEAWIEKKKLNKVITNKKIDELYDHAINCGALGGKVLGAGGGGFLLLYMKKNIRRKFFQKYKKLIHVPFSFTSDNCKIIFEKIER